MAEPRIKSVLIVCRERPTEEQDIYYLVGYGGVTEIKRVIDDLYIVYKGENIIAQVNNPDEVTYFEPEEIKE
jgi:hypothetical protein